MYWLGTVYPISSRLALFIVIPGQPLFSPFYELCSALAPCFLSPARYVHRHSPNPGLSKTVDNRQVLRHNELVASAEAFGQERRVHMKKPAEDKIERGIHVDFDRLAYFGQRLG